MLIGSEAIVELALRKPALFNTRRAWLSNAISYESPRTYEIVTSEKLAEVIEAELSMMPLWRLHIDAKVVDTILREVQEISATYTAKAEECEALIASARAGVDSYSRKKVKPGYEHYQYVRDEQGRRIAEFRKIIEEAGVVIEAIAVGRLLKARVFLNKHRLKQPS